jgi:sugar lactone lactonase YvrE
MTEPTILLTGVALGESPRWHDDRLWFADWGAQELIAMDAAAGRAEVIAAVPSFPFSIDWLPDGTLLIVSAADNAVLRLADDGTLTTHQDLSPLATTPWNEIVVDGRGNTYLNNIGFDFPDGEVTTGIIGLLTADGVASVVADDLSFPNGMVITPDNSTLIVAESYANRLTAFDIAPDGSLGNRLVWADLGDGVPDGLCLDDQGAIWYADVPNQRCVRVREGGEVLQTVPVDRGCFACMLGGSDGSTLFMTAARWPEVMDPTAERSGQVLSWPAPAPTAGHP